MTHLLAKHAKSNPYAPATPCNPRPTREKIIAELTKECEKTQGWDGNTTRPIRIWLVRRALELLVEEAER
jgi:hypothetical protein